MQTDTATPAVAPLQDDEDQPSRRLGGAVGTAVTILCCALALFAVKQVFRPSSDGIQHYLSLFLAGALPLTFLLFPARRRSARTGPDVPQAERPSALDWALAAAAAAAALYPVLSGFDAFLDRQGLPSSTDVALGIVLLVLILEATRRTTGWALPALCLAFLAYGYFGSELPQDWSIAHAGFDVGEIVNALYMGTSGFFGTPLDVAASYIVLFTIYGAVLNASGAGRFFVDLSFAAFRRSGAAPGRTVTMAGFLLGTVSGSGTATAVSLGSVSWPILRRAGYTSEQAGGVLAAAGIGAILSPPTLGAAAFIIAEYLQTSYLTVLVYATIPTLLYYLGIILAIEMDARRRGARTVALQTPVAAARLLLRFGYHFLSLAAIVVFMALGLSALRAVVYATALALALSLLDPAGRIGPRRLVEALAAGARGALAVVATCAAAGAIVAMVTLTGLGLNLAGIIVDAAGALTDDPTFVLLATAVLAAGAITLLGLAVPVTASFIIAAVIVGPALKSLGVADPAVYMFIFYYAVLSEVSPPTALAAVAAAAITGGNALGTMLQTLRYTLPAFLVPLAFVLTDHGEALLAQGSAGEVVAATAASALAVVALAIVTGGWLRGPAGWPERTLCIPAALLLLYLEPATVAAGACCLSVAVGVHLLRRARVPAPLAAGHTHVHPRSEEGR